VTEQGQVLYRAEKRACRRFPRATSPGLFRGVARNFQVFDPLDFIPEPHKHLARHFGWPELSPGCTYT
jgi:hypothetical protein